MIQIREIQSRHIRKQFLACLILLIAVVFPLSFGFMGPSRLVGHDMLNNFLPWKSFLVNELRAGRFPLWDPHPFCGYPFFSNPQAALYYPLDLIVLWVSLDLYPAVFYAIHLSLSALAMYGWIYRHTRSRRAGVVSGLAWVWCGYISRNIFFGFTGLTSAALYIPLGMLLIENWVRERRPRSLALLAIVLALQVFAGHPQPVVYTCYFLMFYAVTLVIHHFRKGRLSRNQAIRTLVLVPVSMAFAMAMTAVQNLPFAEAAQLSAVRQGGVSLEYAGHDSVPLAFWPTFLAPFFYGNPIDQTFWITSTGYQEICGYPGMMIWILALASWRRRPLRTYLWILAFITLIAALGVNGPLFPLLYQVVPGFKWFRDPGRMLILFNFCLAGLAGLGAGDLFRNPRRVFSRRFLIGAGAILVLQLAAVLWLWPMEDHAEESIAAQILHSYPEAQGEIHNLPEPIQYQLLEVRSEQLGMMRQSVLESIGWTLAGILLLLGIRKGLSPGSVVLLGLAVMGADLGRFHFGLLNYMSPEEYRASTFPQSKTVEFLNRDASPFRVMIADDAIGWMTRKYHPELIPERMTVQGIQTVRGYNPTILKYYAQYINRMQGQPHDQWVGGLLFLTDPPSMNRKMLDQLNAKYLLSYGPAPENFVFVLEDRGLAVYENRQVLPRSYVLHDDQVGEEKVAFIEYTPNRVRLSVRMESPGTLVLADTYYQGWKASADGIPLEIEPFDQVFRAVELNKGRHEVEFVFRPFSFYLGLTLSVLSWGCCLGILGRSWWIEWRPRSKRVD